MQTAKYSLLSSIYSIANHNKPQEEIRIAFHFSGTINECFTLKTLLQETNYQISVHYFNKPKYIQEASGADEEGIIDIPLEDNNKDSVKTNFKNLYRKRVAKSNVTTLYSDLGFDDILKEQKTNEDILAKYQQKYRDFNYKEIQLTDDEIEEFSVNFIKTLDDPLLHSSLLSKIDQDLSYIDFYINTHSKIFFSNKFNILDIHDEVKHHNLPINYLTPFADLEQNDISAQVIKNSLEDEDINFNKIYNDNKKLIESLESFHNNIINKGELEKSFAICNLDYNTFFRCLLSYSSIDICEVFVKEFGNFISKEFYIHTLSALPNFDKEREKLISLSLSQGDIKEEELADYK